MYYQKLNVPELNSIKQEVLSYIHENNLIKPDAEEEYFIQMDYSKFPTLNNFVYSRVKTEIVETSSCFLPGNKSLMTHIDVLKKDNGKVPEDRMIANQWVMVIPIADTEEAISYWFSNEQVPDDKEIIVNRVRPEPPYNFYVSFASPDLELNPVETTIIDKPTLIKSDVYHTVVNQGPNTRIVFIVRFKEDKKIYPTPSELFEYKDLV